VQRLGSLLLGPVATAVVPGRRRLALVAEELLDGGPVDASIPQLAGACPSQVVRRERLDPSLGAPPLKDVEHGLVGERLMPDLAPLCERAEQRAGFSPALLDPVLERILAPVGEVDHPVFVALACPHRQRPRLRVIVRHLKLDQLRATEASAVEHGDDRPVPGAGRPVPQPLARLGQRPDLPQVESSPPHQPLTLHPLDAPRPLVLLGVDQAEQPALIQDASDRGERLRDGARREPLRELGPEHLEVMLSDAVPVERADVRLPVLELPSSALFIAAPPPAAEPAGNEVQSAEHRPSGALGQARQVERSRVLVVARNGRQLPGGGQQDLTSCVGGIGHGRRLTKYLVRMLFLILHREPLLSKHLSSTC